MRVMLEMKDCIQNQGRNIQHLHFLTTKIVQGKQITPEELSMERITQYIPIGSYRMLQQIDLKLENSVEFYDHTVSGYMFFCNTLKMY